MFSYMNLLQRKKVLSVGANAPAVPDNTPSVSDTYRRKTLSEETKECLETIERTQQQPRDKVRQEQVLQSDPDSTIEEGDVFTATWNLNTKILTTEIVRKCFSRVDSEDTKALHQGITLVYICRLILNDI